MAGPDDDVAAERARLEAIAWGAGPSEAEAARARIALADLDRRPVRRVARAAAAGADAPGSARPADPVRGTAGPTGAAPIGVDGRAPGGSVPVAGDGADVGQPAEAGVGQPAEAGVAVGGDPGLQDGARSPGTRVQRLGRLVRRHALLFGAGAVALGIAFATGTAVGALQPSVPAAPVVTPTAGTVTLQQLLDAPQTYADQLPGSIDAPVSLHSTRLVFTNRSLSGDDAATPWNVWAGVGRDRSQICLVATADRIVGTTACYPKEDALHGVVSLSASSRSGTLTVRLSGGGVSGTVERSD